MKMVDNLEIIQMFGFFKLYVYVARANVLSIDLSNDTCSENRLSFLLLIYT